MRIKPKMQAYIDNKKFAGISTMVCHKGKIVHFEQVGYGDIEAGKRMLPDTLFRIYSLAKPLVVTAFMMLYEKGMFQLFDPVAKFIPSFRNIKVLETDPSGRKREVDLMRPVTLLDLLTHTSGLTYDFFDDFSVAQDYRQSRLMHDATRNLEGLVDELTRIPLAFQPGSQWHCSLSIDVIACLVEMMSNQPLSQFLQSNIFDPLNMVDTNFYVTPDKLDRLAVVYGGLDIAGVDVTLPMLVKVWAEGINDRLDVSNTYPTDASAGFARGGHGLFSTMQDYMNFAQLLLNRGRFNGESLLSPKIVDLMHVNHLSSMQLPMKFGPKELQGYGFGLGSPVLLDVAKTQMPGSLGSFGWSGAAKTYYWVDPVEELIGILMSQGMMRFDLPEKDFQVLTYQSLIV